MNTKVTRAIALGIAAFLIPSNLLAAEHSAIDPAPRPDQGWKNRQDLLNKRAKEAGEKAEVIFIGDSITEGWEGAGKEVWEQNYSKLNAVNLGIGGGRHQHVLLRLGPRRNDGGEAKEAGGGHGRKKLHCVKKKDEENY